MRISSGVVLVLSVGFAASCSSGSHGAPVDGAGDAAVEDGAGDGPGDGRITPPDSPAGRALAWLLRGLNGTVPTQAEVTAEFTAEFLQQVPATDLIELLVQLSQARPWTLSALAGMPSATDLVAVLVRGDGQYWRLTIDVDLEGRIAGALIQPAPELDPALDSWDEIDAALVALAPRANLLAATVDPAGCSPLHAVGPDTSLALGSTFKL